MPVALRRTALAVVRSIQVFFQAVPYAGLFIFARYLVSWLYLPLPANLVGTILMLALIICRTLPLQWVRTGARWLLVEMLLLLIPVAVAVVNYTQLSLADGWHIFTVVALSTVTMLGTTAWVVEKVYRYEMRRLDRG